MQKLRSIILIVLGLSLIPISLAQARDVSGSIPGQEQTQTSCIPDACIWARATTDQAEIAILPNVIQVYDRTSCEVLYTQPLEELNLYDPSPGFAVESNRPKRIPSIEISPDGKYAAVSANGMHIFNTSTWQEMEIPALENTTQQAISSFWSPTGQYLLYEDALTLYALNWETRESIAIVSNILHHAGNTAYVLELRSLYFDPDENWIEMEWDYWESQSTMVVRLDTGENIWSGEDGYGYGCSRLHWWGDANSIFAAACFYPYGNNPGDTLYVCSTADAECITHYFSEGVITVNGWTETGNLLFRWEKDDEEEHVGEICYLLSKDSLSWALADCDMPVQPGFDIKPFTPEEKINQSTGCELP